jgi:hypothetical protein
MCRPSPAPSRRWIPSRCRLSAGRAATAAVGLLRFSGLSSALFLLRAGDSRGRTQAAQSCTHVCAPGPRRGAAGLVRLEAAQPCPTPTGGSNRVKPGAFARAVRVHARRARAARTPRARTVPRRAPGRGATQRSRIARRRGFGEKKYSFIINLATTLSDILVFNSHAL